MRVAEVKSIWVHLLLATASAVMLLLAFPQPGWWLLAHVGLVPMTLLALRAVKARHVVWTSWLAGFAWWLVIVRWLVPITGGGFVALSAYLAVYFPLAMLLVRRVDREWQLPMTVALPMVWVACEWVRGIILAGGFGWYMIGHVHAPYEPDHGASRLIQIADLFGEWGVSGLVAMTNGLIVDLLNRPLWRSPNADQRKPNPVLVAMAGLWVGSTAGAWAYGQWRISQTNGLETREVVAGVVQTNVAQSNKNSPTESQREKDWQDMLSMMRAAAQHDPAPVFVATPETMTPGPINPEAAAVSSDSRRYRSELSELAKQERAHLLVGSSTIVPEPYRRSNSVYHIDRDGRYNPLVFHKVHRVPFGEYVPWVDGWPSLRTFFIKNLTPYDFDYTLTPGRELTVFEMASPQGEPVRVATPICFEDAVSRFTRRLVYERKSGDPPGKRVDLLVNVTNDGWFEGSAEPWQHMQLAVFRCVENRVPMARSVNGGVSGFIDSAGRVQELVTSEGRSVNVAGWSVQTMRLDDRQTVYGQVGALPVWLMMSGLGALLVVPIVKRRKLSKQPEKKGLQPDKRGRSKTKRR